MRATALTCLTAFFSLSSVASGLASGAERDLHEVSSNSRQLSEGLSKREIDVPLTCATPCSAQDTVQNQCLKSSSDAATQVRCLCSANSLQVLAKCIRCTVSNGGSAIVNGSSVSFDTYMYNYMDPCYGVGIVIQSSVYSSISAHATEYALASTPIASTTTPVGTTTPAVGTTTPQVGTTTTPVASTTTPAGATPTTPGNSVGSTTSPTPFGAQASNPSSPAVYQFTPAPFPSVNPSKSWGDPSQPGPHFALFAILAAGFAAQIGELL